MSENVIGFLQGKAPMLSHHKSRFRIIAIPLIMAVVLALFDGVGCRKVDQVARERILVSSAIAQTSANCQSCHEEIHAAWKDTDHALANRPVELIGDKEALASFHPPAGIGPGSAPSLILGHPPLKNSAKRRPAAQ